ncbi:MAG: NAD(P)/FAD-dependent oxidoreductase, partial [Phycisphaerales bacterium]|nr:NAD(P)/FAD-dependent oxidoreductase [Phycisphaerales bacterium]
MAPSPAAGRPHVVIVGAGFAGLWAARALRNAHADITVVDRQNHHLFQPLLYQVATAALSPAHVAAPIRKVLSRQRNCRVVMAQVESIDAPARRVHLAHAAPLAFDYLIVATGVTHSYFGHDAWARHAPGLKDIDDALEIRRRFLLAFERAEVEPDADRRRAELTFVIVGAGPTGVELAGAIAEISRTSIPRDFRRIDTRSTRVILVEAEDRVLSSFPDTLARRAQRDLEHLGVQVWTGRRVTAIDERGVAIGPERLESRNVFWAAGIRASSLASSLGESAGAQTDRAGRVLVDKDLSVPGHPRVFVAGDLASLPDPATGQPVPGVAPA